MPIAEHHGLRIDFTDEGAGAPVMLLHSSVSGNRQWRKLSAQLAGRYRVIAPNLRGYGATSAWHGQRRQTLADAAQVVLSLREALALDDEPLRLVGHSWGGAVALQAAHVLGQQVSHLALYEPMLPGLLKAHGRLEAAAETGALLCRPAPPGARRPVAGVGRALHQLLQRRRRVGRQRRRAPAPHRRGAAAQPARVGRLHGTAARARRSPASVPRAC